MLWVGTQTQCVNGVGVEKVALLFLFLKLTVESFRERCRLRKAPHTALWRHHEGVLPNNNKIIKSNKVVLILDKIDTPPLRPPPRGNWLTVALQTSPRSRISHCQRHSHTLVTSSSGELYGCVCLLPWASGLLWTRYGLLTDLQYAHAPRTRTPRQGQSAAAHGYLQREKLSARTWSSWKLAKNGPSQAPPVPHWIRVCTLTSSPSWFTGTVTKRSLTVHSWEQLGGQCWFLY